MRTRAALAGIALLALLAYAFAHRTFTRTEDNPIIANLAPSSPMAATMTLASSAFAGNATIPAQFTCDGGEASPPLSIAGVPGNAKSLALVMDDPNVPKRLKSDGVFDHWVLFNIPPQTHEIASGASAGTPGRNSAGQNGYIGPCPPPQYEPSEHRYVFTLYALDDELALPAGASKSDVLNAMEGRVIAKAQLVGRYKRN